MNENWVKDHLAFSIKNNWVERLKSWSMIFKICFGAIILIEVSVLFFFLNPWLVLIPIGLVILVGLIIAALAVFFLRSSIRIGGQTYRFLAVEDVENMKALILRWRFPGEKQVASDYNPRSDSEMYRAFPSGLCVYSPLFYNREGLVDLQPQVIPHDPIEVNAEDGQLVAVDSQVTGEVTDPVLFFLNAGNDISRMKIILFEYLHTALQRMTSVWRGQELIEGMPEEIKAKKGMPPPNLRLYLPILVPEKVQVEGVEGVEVEGVGGLVRQFVARWKCSTDQLTKANDTVQSRMGKFASGLVNHWMNGGEQEQSFGYRVKIKITALLPPEKFAAAQEAKEAAGLQADEVRTQAAGYADMLTQIQDAVRTLSPEVQARLTELIAEPNTPPEVLNRALTVMAAGQPNSTVLTAVAALVPTIRDTMEFLFGGKRAKSNPPVNQEKTE